MFALIYDTPATFNVNPSPFIIAEFDTRKGYTMSNPRKEQGIPKCSFPYMLMYIFVNTSYVLYPLRE